MPWGQLNKKYSLTDTKIIILVYFQVQFVAIFTHQFQVLFTDCNYPKGFMIWIGLHGLMFLFLFSDFYKAKYNNKKLKSNDGACMVSITFCLIKLFDVKYG